MFCFFLKRTNSVQYIRFWVVGCNFSWNYNRLNCSCSANYYKNQLEMFKKIGAWLILKQIWRWTSAFLCQVSDYLGLDWMGSLEVSTEMEEFKAINMDPEQNAEASNKQLSLSIHASHKNALDLFVFSPYWLINKTGLPVQIRVSQMHLCSFLLCYHFCFILLVVFSVPSTVRSFRDDTSIYCLLRRTWSSFFYTIPTRNRTLGHHVAVHYTTACHASSSIFVLYFFSIFGWPLTYTEYINRGNHQRLDIITHCYLNAW